MKDLEGKLEDHNVWMIGTPGIGKTGWERNFFADHGGYFDKDKSKYWNNYDFEPNILIDDIEKSDTHMLGNLKRWMQHKPFQAEDKYGGFKHIRP